MGPALCLTFLTVVVLPHEHEYTESLYLFHVVVFFAKVSFAGQYVVLYCTSSPRVKGFYRLRQQGAVKEKIGVLVDVILVHVI